MPIEYPFGNVPEYGEPDQVARGIWRVRLPMHPPLKAVNIYLMADGDGLSIVDTGLNNDATRQVWEQLARGFLAARRPTRLLLTHHHPDHAGLLRWLCERWNLPYQMTSAEQERLLPGARQAGSQDADGRMLRAGVPDEVIHWRRAAPHKPESEPAGLPPTEWLPMAGGEQVRIGQDDWEVIEGAGHTPGHASLFCASRRLLISGDQVLPRVHASLDTWGGLPPDGLLQRWLDSFARLQSLPQDTLVFPSHNEPFLGLHTRLDEMTAYHEGRLRTMLEMCAQQPHSVWDIVDATSALGQTSHALYLSCGTVAAGLDLLAARGLARRETDADGIERWRPTAGAPANPGL